MSDTWLPWPLYREWGSPVLHASQRMPMAAAKAEASHLTIINSKICCSWAYFRQQSPTQLNQCSFGIWFERELALIAIKISNWYATYKYGCFDVQDTISYAIRVRVKKVSTLHSIHQSCLHSCQNPNLLCLIFKLIFKFLSINIIYAILQAWSEKSVTK